VARRTRQTAMGKEDFMGVVKLTFWRLRGIQKKNLRSKNEDEDDNKKPKDREASPTCGDLSFGFDLKRSRTRTRTIGEAEDGN
jgi:hypothetical protein